MKALLFGNAERDHHKVAAFFLSSIEAAEEWAELLERESIRTAISGFEIDKDYQEKSQKFRAFVYLIVTNLTAFSGDFIITNPGSACMGIFAQARSPGMYYWHCGSYFPSENASVANEFIRAVHQQDLGKSAQKSNFFPLGTKLTSEEIHFHPRFIDGLIARRGKTVVEDLSDDGRDMCGGILREVFSYPVNSQRFNKNTKFCGVFVLAYKRKPGDAINPNPKKTLGIVRDELAQAKDRDRDERKVDNEQSDASVKGASNFW
jgi:hypothetical protein